MMTSDIAVERRARDGRLAWMILGACATLSLCLLVALFFLLRGPVLRNVEDQMRAQREVGQAARAREMDAWRAAAPVPPTVPEVTLVNPPSTAVPRPVGNVAALFGPDTYPAAALRAGEEGRVRVRVTVDPLGMPTGCAVAESSGSWALDTGTCGILLRGGRFDRAPRGVKGVRFWTSPGVRWQLPR